MGAPHKARPAEKIENRMRQLREERGLVQTDLARCTGISRQAIYAIEHNQYLPTTAVALRLAHALGCRVEDLFSLVMPGQVIEGEWVGAAEPAGPRTRVK